MSDYETARLLKELRSEFDYSLKDIADYLGVSISAVSKWENGDDIKTENLYKLSKLYGVTFFELYEGKLNKEDIERYWKRNFDLSNFEIDEKSINENIEEVKKLFERISSIRNKFLLMLPNWANDKLTEDELGIFKLFKQYFNFDNNYYANITTDHTICFVFDEKKEKEFVLRIVKENKNSSKEMLEWEISKIYNFNYDYKKDLMWENLKTFEYMLSSLSQIEKDLLLNHYVNEVKEDVLKEIEDDLYIKAILNSGANIIYQNKSLPPTLDNKMFEFADGIKVKIDNSKYEYSFIDASGRSIFLLKNWKFFSYKNYKRMIDNNETERLKDIVNLRNLNPLQYYKNIREREYK